MRRLERRITSAVVLAATVLACQSSTATTVLQPAAQAAPILEATPQSLGLLRPVGPPAPTVEPSAPVEAPAAPAAGPAQPATPQATATAAPAPTATLPADPAARALARSEASYDAGKYADALALLDAGPLPPDAADLVALRRGELSIELGATDRARAELAKPELTATRNRMLLVRAAQAFERLGDAPRAAELWLRSAEQPTWNAERLLARRAAALDYARAGMSDAAAVTLAAMVDGGASGGPPASGLESVAALGPHHAGLVALMNGNYAQAAAQFRRYLAEQPSGEYAAAARKRLNALEATPVRDPDGWIATRDLDTAAAYRAWVEANPGSTRVPEARFREGLARYRTGDVAGGLAVFQSLGGNSETTARAQYWAGKALERLDRGQEARASYVAAAGQRPSSYYSARAADRLNGEVGWPGSAPTLPNSFPSAADEVELREWMGKWAPATGPDAAEATRIRRAALFASVGLERTATAELDGLIEATRNPWTAYEAGKVAVANQLWSSATRAGVKLGGLGPERQGADAPMAVRRLAYPAGYPELVAAESARRDIGPLLLLSLMRQESIFDRFARSSADARGLTQVMPATGAGLAKAFGRSSFSADDLFDPSLSIAFGAKYVADQIAYFKGDVFRAVAAYNAGGGAAARWAPDATDPDIFVESIEYAETRAYVQHIYHYHAVYRGLVS